VDDHITALDARVAVAAGGPASHLDPGHRRAQHEMRVVEVDKIIAEIIFEKGRLFIGARFSDSADRRVAASRALFEENRDAAVLEVVALVAIDRQASQTISRGRLRHSFPETRA
jgi:hypothetical protein